MYYFLDYYFGITNSDDVAVLLGGLNLTEDGYSFDPAYLIQWNECIEMAIRDDD